MSGNQDFVIENGVLKEYNGPGGVVVIPEGVTEIYWAAFRNCAGLTEVALPSSLRNFGSSAFAGCTGLTQITLPEGVTKISYMAFADCTALTRVTIPEGLIEIEREAFRGCTSLTEIDLPGSVIAIDMDAFRDCTSLTKFTVPKGVSFPDISGTGYNVFVNCHQLKDLRVAEGNPNLTAEGGALYNADRTVLIAWPGAEGHVELPGTVERLSSQAFTGCTGLTSLTIRSKMESNVNSRQPINALAFTGCINLTQVRVNPENQVLYAQDGALYRREENGPVLVSWPAARGAVVVPDGVVKIGNSAFQDCTNLTQVTIPNSVTQIGPKAFRGCTNLTHVKLPAGLKRLGNNAFEGCTALEELTFPQGMEDISLDSFKGCTHLKRITLPETVKEVSNYWPGDTNFPRFAVETTLLRTGKKLSNNLSSLVYFSGGENLAYVVLYQGTKAWQEALKGRIGKDPTLAEDVVLALNRLLTGEIQIKKAEWERAAAFVLKWQEKVKTGTLQAFYDLAKEKKAPVLADLEGDSGVRKRITLAGGQTAQDAAQPPENPVEKLVWEQWKVTPTVKKLQKLVKQGVRYAGSEELCSKEALIWLVAFMVDAQAEFEYMTTKNAARILESIRKNLDPIAAGLDRAALMEFLDMMVFSGTNIKLFIPAYCRYADEEQMGKLVKQMKAWHQWSVYGATGRNYVSCVMDNLYYSETKAAMRACNLKSYAAIRGTDEQTLRDTVLADLGLDREGKKYYDLGGRTVEARMEEDLTLTLYDPEAGKVVKSMPKKGADPEKYEAAKKDFARLKKDIRTAVKERVNLLFQRFLDGEGQKGEDWKKVYFQNPMLNQIARLLVWSQDGKTFIMTAQGTVDAAGQPYEVGDKPVKVAHPMDMSKKDLEHWQKYFISHSLKQPFEQVWEPVVDFSAVRKDRYQGLTLLANQLRSQDRHGIYFNYDNGASELETGFADLDLECNFTQFQRHWMDQDARVVFGTLKVRKESRAANHVLVKLDRWLAAERVRKDDATVVDVLDSFTLAQVTELLNLAIGNQCTNCTAALLEYKNQMFPDFDPMDVFTLE